MDANLHTLPVWLTLEEAAEYLRVSPHTLRSWAYQRLVRAHKGPSLSGKSPLRFRQEDLDAALQPLGPLTEAEVAASA